MNIASELKRLMVEQVLREYSEDQPRDDYGRWTSGGGTAVLDTDVKKHPIRKLEKMYREADADLCKEHPELCQENVGISRDKMPQLDGSVAREFVTDLRKSGIKVTTETVPIDSLKATQNQIDTSNALKKAVSFLKGEYPGIKNAIIVSKDGHILDGHHRWAGLQLAERVKGKQNMQIERVHMNIKDLLRRALNYEGVEKRAMGEARSLILAMLCS